MSSKLKYLYFHLFRTPIKYCCILIMRLKIFFIIIQKWYFCVVIHVKSIENVCNIIFYAKTQYQYKKNIYISYVGLFLQITTNKPGNTFWWMNNTKGLKITYWWRVKCFIIFDTNNLTFITFFDFFVASIGDMYLESTWDIL